MSFKFFRKHQKVMLWIIVVITVFTFSLFSVTSTMRTCFRQEGEIDAVADFKAANGEDVMVDLRMYYHAEGVLRIAAMIGLHPPPTYEDVYSHIILSHEARQSGIVVPNEQLGEFVSMILGRAQLSNTKEDYRRLVNDYFGVDMAKFEQALREYILVLNFRQYANLSDNWTSSESLYDEYKLENEEFELAFVDYPYDQYDEKIDPASITDEELKEWFDGLNLFDAEVRDHMSHPEEFEFDVAYIDLAGAEFEAFEELTKEIAFQPYELERYYESIKDVRFKIEPEEEEVTEVEEIEEEETEAEETEAEETEEEVSEEEKPEEEEEPKVEYVMLDEVKDELEKELKLAKLVEQACTNWVEYAREKDIIGKIDEEPEGDEGTEAAETPDEKFEAILAEFKLSKDRVEGPVSLDDLETYEGYGSEYLSRRIRHLQANNGVYLSPREEHPNTAFFIRVTEKVDRKKMEFEEAKEVILERYIHKQKFDMAQEDGMAFVDTLKERARDLTVVQETVSQWEEDARRLAGDSIEDLGVISPEEYEARLSEVEEREMKKIDGEVESLLRRHLYEFWDEEIQARNLEVQHVDPYRKSIIRTPDFLQREDSAEKFVMSYRRIFDLDKNAVLMPINDRNGESWIVVRVMDRRFPPASTMTEENYRETAMSLEQQRMRDLRMQSQGVGNMGQRPEPEEKVDPFSYQSLAMAHDLRLYKQQEQEEEAPQDSESDK